MKTIKLAAIFAAITLSATAQKVSDRVAIIGSAVDPAVDIIGIVDTSAGTSGSKKITLAELVNVSSFTNGNFLAANSIEIAQVNGLAGALASGGGDLTSGPVLSTGGLSSIADAALSIAKTNGLQTAMDAKRNYDNAAFNLILDGDSIFQGGTWGGATVGNYLQDRLPLKSYFSGAGRTTIVNVASAGAVVANVVSDYAAQVYPYRPANQAGKRAVLCVLVGTNAVDASDALATSNVASLVSYATTAKADGFEVWLCTLLPKNTTPPFYWDNFNNLLRKSIVPDKLIDLNRGFRDPTDVTIMGDSLHLTNLGYDRMADAINSAAWEEKTPITSGSMALQSANAVAITGGLLSGATADFVSLAVSNVANAQFQLNPTGAAETNFFSNSESNTFGVGHTNNAGTYKTAYFFNPDCTSYWSSVMSTPGYMIRDPSNWGNIWGSWNATSSTFSLSASGTNQNIALTPSGTGSVVASTGIIQSPPASATPATNGQLLFEATSNTSLTVKLKGTDGTVRSVVLTLAP